MSENSRWPPLNCLRGFVAAARHNSFSDAAQSLHITQSAVSHQIRTLESWLGQPLFIRHRRRVQLTDAGSDLLGTAENCLATLDRGIRRLEQYKKPNQLIVHTGADFANGWLVSRLARYRVQHPAVDVWLYTTENTPDPDLAETHCAILRGDGDWQGLDSTRLFDDAQVPLCAPDHPLLDNPGRTAIDLLDQVLLHDEDEITWGDWFRAAGLAQANPVEGPNFSSQALMLQAAELGQGIALASQVVAADRLESGRLVVPVPIALPASQGYYLLRREEGLRSEHLDGFIDWLRETSREQAAMALDLGLAGAQS